MTKKKSTLSIDKKSLDGGIIKPPIVKYSCKSCGGKFLSQSINWSKDRKPLCPKCNGVLERVG